MNNQLKIDGLTTSAEVTLITKNGILLYLNGKEYFLGYEGYPWFRTARVNEVMDVKLDDCNVLRWEALDVDLEVDSIIHPEKYPLIYS